MMFPIKIIHAPVMFQKHGEFSFLGAFANVVNHHHQGKIEHGEASFLCPITEIHILNIHIKSFI